MALQLLVLYSEMRNHHHGLDAKTLQYVCITHTECVRQVFLSNSLCRRHRIGYFVYHSENPLISIVSHDQTNGQSMNTHSNPGSEFVKLGTTQWLQCRFLSAQHSRLSSNRG